MISYRNRWYTGPLCYQCGAEKFRRLKGMKPKNKSFNVKEYKAQWYLKNKKRLSEQNKIYRLKHKEELKIKRRLYYQNTVQNYPKRILDTLEQKKQKRKEQLQKHKINNPEKIKQYRQKWKSNNKGLVSYYTNKRRKYIKLRTPYWVNQKDIRNIYKNRPNGCDVDHIIPLQGKNVSGLHVPWNLQYLDRKENQKKSNKF